MKILFQILIFLFAGINLFAGNGRYEYYSGTIGKTQVEMTVFSDSTGKLSGFYHYIGREGMLNLAGKMTKNGSWEIDEYSDRGISGDHDYSLKTGMFSGKKFSKDSLCGIWKSSNQGKELEFRLINNAGKNGADIEMKSVQKVHGYRNKNKDTLAVITAEIQWLKITSGNDSVAEKINRSIFKKLCPLWGDECKATYPNYDSVANNFIRNSWKGMREDLENEFPAEHENNNDWSAISTCDVAWNGGGILCLYFYTSGYTGGAIAQWDDFYVCYDLATGDEIVLSKIFLPGYKKNLKEIVKSHFQNANASYDESSDSLPLRNNYSITPDGITFYYWEYGSHNSGAASSFIPWHELNAWIDPNGVMGWVKK